MPQSSCPKCGRTAFEIAPHQPKHCTRTLAFVRCSSCGAVVAAMEMYDVAAKLDEIRDLLRRLSRG